MTAEDYIKQEMVAGRLTYHHIAELVACFQDANNLVVDGMPGPKTIMALEAHGSFFALKAAAPPPHRWLAVPLPVLTYPDMSPRYAQVTSGFHTVNPSRPTHNGCDFFYPWRMGDKPDQVGNGLAATRLPSGQPKWVVPYGVTARAAAEGTIQIAGNTATGYRCWVDHGNGWRTGYFHLRGLEVAVGDKVSEGDPLGEVGDNPKDGDARHLHFELSPVSHYAPVDPEPFLRKP